MSTLIREYGPALPLAPYVEAYWTGDFNRDREQDVSQLVVPNGCIELIIHLTDDHCALSTRDRWEQSPDLTLIGLFTTPYEVRFPSQVKVFGIRFHPEGIHNLFGVPPRHFSASYEDSTLVFGDGFGNYCDRLRELSVDADKITLTENFLLRQLSRHRSCFDYTGLAAGVIREHDGNLRLEKLISQIPVSPRQLQREFKNRYGISPKAYMRLARLNAVHRYMQHTPAIDFSAITFLHGFSDQPHFIREFKSFTGNNPGEFARAREKFIVNPGQK